MVDTITVPDKRYVRSVHDVVTFRGTSFPRKFLRDSLPDMTTALFFAKVYDLSPADVAVLVSEVLPSEVTAAFFDEDALHSHELQDYLVDGFYDPLTHEWRAVVDDPEHGSAPAEPVHAEILPEVWRNLEVQIAASIQEVASTIAGSIARLPGRTGEMVFRSMATMNARRPVVGDYRAQINHQHVKQVLVVFDVSGSMSETTVRTIVDDVVGLAYEANASLALVSNTCTFFDPGAFSTKAVLEAAEYGGTHYEALLPLFTDRTWDVVVTIADYDSSLSAHRVLGEATGRIGELLDVSLVSRSTYLSECLGQLADTVRPLLVSKADLTGGW